VEGRVAYGAFDEGGEEAAQSRNGRHSGLRHAGDRDGARRGADLMSVAERRSAGRDDQLGRGEAIVWRWLRGSLERVRVEPANERATASAGRPDGGPR
jgi:hypothetical protein